ncbi:hypothetical protein NKR23_g7406 [Pleurostoma richardsiae]|uniref:Prenylated Rab acceptor 1 n=1 Tax=Pleurostoma richardsiae TaxID=41990 RepID=A0AA38RBH0_9PEZI|nr:hypothetical protein NKR23_g7406 [Pleurostoma richardsiae]
MSRSRRAYTYEPSEDDDEDSSDHSDSEGSSGQAQILMKEKEEALIESALRRIKRAQAKGKKEVKLNKEELAALERRRKRMQEESRGSTSSGSERRKRKEQRFAVPISQLEPTSRKRRGVAPSPEDVLPRHASAEALNRPRDQPVYPPMGYFPPPSATRTRPRSVTSSSQRPPSRDPNLGQGSSPFRYSYAQPDSQSSLRHVSDTAARPRSSRGPLPYEEAWVPNHNLTVPPPPVTGSRQSLPVDPFQYMTGDSRAPYPTGAGATTRRYVSGPAGDTTGAYVNSIPRGTPPAAARGGRTSRRVTPEETSEEDTEEDEQTSDDDLDQGARVVTTDSSRSRGREEILVEVERKQTPEPEPSKPKKSSGSSPSKRKGLRSSPARRRKGK